MEGEKPIPIAVPLCHQRSRTRYKYTFMDVWESEKGKGGERKKVEGTEKISHVSLLQK